MESKLLVLVVFVWAICHVTEAQLITPTTLGTNITSAGCGTSKLCVSSVPNCSASGNSSCFFSSIQVNNQTLSIELTGTISGYVALGLASNQSQGGSVVFVCGNNNSTAVFFQTTTQSGTTLTPANVSTVYNVQGSLQQKLVQCTFNTSTNLVINNGNNFIISNTTTAYLILLSGSTNGTQLGNAATVFNSSTPINLTNSTVNLSNSPVSISNIAVNGTNSATNGTNIAITSTNIAANGTNSATNGTNSAANGTNSATNGTNSAITGTNIAANGTNSATNGTNSATNGTNSAANGTNSTTNGTNSAANGTNSAANGTNSAANGTNSATNGTNSIVNGANSATNGANSTNISQLNITGNGCGSTKLCLSNTASCNPTVTNCFFTSSKMNNQTFSFELSGPTSGYVALALTKENSTYVFVCGNNSGSFFFQTDTQNGSVLTPANVSTVYSFAGAVTQNQSLIQCVFNTSTSFNISTRASNLFTISILNGTTNGTLLGNAIQQAVTSKSVDLSNPGALSTSPTTANGTKLLVSNWTQVLALLLSAMSLHFITSHSP